MISMVAWWMTVLIPGSAPEDAGVIVGRIVDTASGEAVAEAQIVVPAQGVGTVSDDHGYFGLQGVQGGPGPVVAVAIAHPCFHTLRVEVTLDPQGTALELRLPFNGSVHRPAAARSLASCQLLFGR